MTLPAGTRFGSYEITAPIGAGGMGEIYRAHDSTLQRDVAIKVLPEPFGSDPDRLARFEREARALAALNHPNIAAVYAVEEAPTASGPSRAIVMELVEGEDLAERLQRGPVPLGDAIAIARQIADALEAAHDREIVHRDLKPANIRVRDDGTVKVLDFGLAKALGPDSDPESPDARNSPTLTARATQLGVILGTAAYMAPEQAKGRRVDKRADIWAFGVVLYEMLTGKRLFAADDASDTLAAVLRADINLVALPEGTPASVRRVLERCLVRDPRHRLRDIGDARLDLNADVERIDVPRPPAVERSHARGLERTLFAIAIVALSAALAIALSSTRVLPAPAQVIRATLPFAGVPSSYRMTQPPVGAAAFYGIVEPGIAISADGSTVVYVGTANRQKGLFVRRLDQAQPTLIRGAENGLGPFLSPDGRWVGFWSPDGHLKKVAIDGGVPVTLTDAADVRGASWGRDGMIVYSPDSQSGLWRVKDSGGSPEPLTTLDVARHEKTHRMPDVLPNGKGVLFMIGTTDVDSWDGSVIAALPPGGGTPKVVLKGGMMPRYVEPGHLVYVHGGDLLAAPFDADRLEVTGPAVSVASDVALTNTMGVAEAAVSSRVLTYLTGQSTVPNSAFIEVSRTGAARPVSSLSRVFISGRWLPDQKRILTNIDAGNGIVWMLDPDRDALSRVTFHDDAGSQAWNRVTGRAVYVGVGEIVSVTPDGSGREEVVFHRGGLIGVVDVSSDGRFIIFEGIDGATVQLWLLSTATQKAERWLPSRFIQGQPRFSPDGRWVAFVSNQTGEPQVFVRATEGGDSTLRVSTTLGTTPVWSPTGRELFYSDRESLWAAEVRTVDRRIEAGKPRRLFKLPERSVFQDVSPDGQLFLLLQAEPSPAPSAIAVVSGWLEALTPKR